MDVLFKLMDILKEKKNFNYEKSKFCFFDKSKVFSHTEFFYELTNSFKPTIDEKTELIYLYIESKNIINRLNNFIKLIKWKKALKYENDYDLFLTPLSTFPHDQKISLLENKTIYKFRLSDLVNYWVTCLYNSEGLFSKPMLPKNPHTNMDISKHNLINIYVKLLESYFDIPFCIKAFYLSKLDVDTFLYDNYCFLKEKTIENFILNGTIYEKYEQVLNLMHEYRTILHYTTIVNNCPADIKVKLCSSFKHILPYYIKSKFSCNPLVKRDNKTILKEALKRFYNNNPYLGIDRYFVTNYDYFRPPSTDPPPLGPPTPQPPPLPSTIRSRRPTVPPPPPPPTSITTSNIVIPNVMPENITPQSNNIQTNRLETISEDDVNSTNNETENSNENMNNNLNNNLNEEYNYSSDSDMDIDTDIDPFSPTHELNRSPPNNIVARQNQMSNQFTLFRRN